MPLRRHGKTYYWGNTRLGKKGKTVSKSKALRQVRAIKASQARRGKGAKR